MGLGLGPCLRRGALCPLGQLPLPTGLPSVYLGFHYDNYLGFPIPREAGQLDVMTHLSEETTEAQRGIDLACVHTASDSSVSCSHVDRAQVPAERPWWLVTQKAQPHSCVSGWRTSPSGQRWRMSLTAN